MPDYDVLPDDSKGYREFFVYDIEEGWPGEYDEPAAGPFDCEHEANEWIGEHVD